LKRVSGTDFMRLIFGGELVDEDSWEVIHRSPCQADPSRFKIIATVGRPLGEVLSIIYLSQLNSKYTRSPLSVSYTFQRHNILIGHDGSVAITFIRDDEELEALRAMVIRTINAAIAYGLTHREPLDALMEEKRALSPMRLYESFRAVPKADCGECGEASCFGFTAKLFNGGRDVKDCPHVNAAEVERRLKPIRL
jgi:ArsR family metal-binding transcriptional regulator